MALEKGPRQGHLPSAEASASVADALRHFNTYLLRTLLVGYHITRPELTEGQVIEMQRLLEVYVSLIPIGKGSYRKRYAEKSWDIKVAPKTREKIFAERGGTCYACRNVIQPGPNAFHLHHTDYVNYKDRSKIQVLCHKCHHRVDIVTAFALLLCHEDVGIESPRIRFGQNGGSQDVETQQAMFE